VVEKFETLFDELLNKPARKVSDEFERLLNLKPKPKNQPKTWPERIVPIREKGEAELTREDGTRVIKLSDAMEAVFRVLNNDPDWGPRAGADGGKITAQDALNFLDNIASQLVTGDTTVEYRLTRIAQLMKAKLLPQNRPRHYGTKTGRFRS